MMKKLLLLPEEEQKGPKWGAMWSVESFHIYFRLFVFACCNKVEVRPCIMSICLHYCLLVI